ncbi:hypothetical protein GALMADRAFT_1038219 [Galerina marginata CBS 339.88]|uniref:Uncharacterized protein n=1 Tax=Galerina marginata (strain CBS 339.88) TaxID=685588 RepID=A0A067SPD1_GALM3|nr:hypothetical protein GALMADRAFT_1038219 [Galerina marginata CBS 339.88]
MILNNLFSAALFTTVSTTLVTTVLIAYRIYSVAHQNGQDFFKKSFKNILDLLVQSAAAYSILSILYAVCGVTPLKDPNINLPKIFPLEVYMGLLYSFTAGVSPTIMVARIVLAKTANDESVTAAHISGLQFHGRTTSATSTQSRTNSIHAVGGGDSLASDPEKGG